jgi:hypothetical protein
LLLLTYRPSSTTIGKQPSFSAGAFIYRYGMGASSRPTSRISLKEGSLLISIAAFVS